MKTILIKAKVPDDFPVDNNTTIVDVEIWGVDGDGDRYYNDYYAKRIQLPTNEEIRDYCLNTCPEDYQKFMDVWINGANYILNAIKQPEL